MASNLESQLGNLANFIAYAFMGIPAGKMLERIGYKKTALAAIAVGFVGVCVTFLSGSAGLCGIPNRCFYLWFLYVYAKRGSKPYA